METKRTYYKKIRNLILEKGDNTGKGLYNLYTYRYGGAEFRFLKGGKSIVIDVKGKHFEIKPVCLNVIYIFGRKIAPVKLKNLKNWHDLLTKK